jgi:hypothetical protein
MHADRAAHDMTDWRRPKGFSMMDGDVNTLGFKAALGGGVRIMASWP